MINIDEEILKNKCNSGNLENISKKKNSKLVSKNKCLEYSYSSPVIRLKKKKNSSKLNKIVEISKVFYEKKNDISTIISPCKKLDEKVINLKKKSLNKKLDKKINYKNSNNSMKINLDKKNYSNSNNLSYGEKYNAIKEKKETLKKMETSNISNSSSYNIYQLNENFHFKKDNIMESSNEVKLSNSKYLKGRCILKRLNGETKELNINEVNNILVNYIPYQTSDVVKANEFKTKRSFSSIPNSLEDLTSLPIVYEKGDFELVKKCRDASKKRIIHKNWPNSKMPSKIKLPIQKKYKILTHSNLNLKYGEYHSYKTNEEKKRSVTTFNYSSKNFRSLSCTNMNYSDNNEKIKNRKSSKKSIFCDSEEFYMTPVGEAKLCGFEKEFMRLESNQEKIHLFHPSQVKHSKTIISPNINSIKENLTSMVLKHSKNMILSKLKKEKTKKKNNSKNRNNSLVDSILENDNFSKWNFLGNSKNLQNTTYQEAKNRINDENEKNKISYENNDSFILNYNKKLNHSKNLIIRKTKSPFRIIEQDLTIAEILTEKPRVKSVEKKKVIEKINDYKVIYKSEDIMSIYKSNKNKEKDEHFLDVTSLLCKPGYIGNYLCETTSTINLSYIKKKKEESEKKKIIEDNNKDNEKMRENYISCNNEYYVSGENREKNEKYQHEQNECTKYKNMFELNKDENDEILHYLKEAIKNASAINVDLQYIMIIFNEILEKEKRIIYKKELLPSSTNEINSINKNIRNNVLYSHCNKYTQKSDYLKKYYKNYNIYKNNLSSNYNILNKGVLNSFNNSKITNNKNNISSSYNNYIINNVSNEKMVLNNFNNR
ncbi:conserved Plasmodium protein, unknown function [Plasmodium relictum]|uniref:Uncharacterized protein n=1 Tax=Plasmodium relictum TaxID=85471 RepID=A0A1J1H5Z6_PLARL|nr:conserved Plasmodium protein, unknown function [Plasmodium relictum]CRH00321.1 conserved Plasmodium protein, unknown function [Plasmodium relictum]